MFKAYYKYGFSFTDDDDTGVDFNEAANQDGIQYQEDLNLDLDDNPDHQANCPGPDDSDQNDDPDPDDDPDQNDDPDPDDDRDDPDLNDSQESSDDSVVNDEIEDGDYQVSLITHILLCILVQNPFHQH